MDLKQGAANIPNGGSQDFRSKEVGTDTDTIFTIANTGTAGLNLTTLPLTVGGADLGEFSIHVQPTSPVTAGSIVTFTVRFSPSSLGSKSATVSIANNDSDENPYMLNLTGEGTDLIVRILWNHTDSTVTLWQVDPSDERWISGKYYGPYPGWSAAGYFRQPDDSEGRLLWNHTAGTACLWTLDTNDDWTGQKYFGPFAGWTAVNYYRPAISYGATPMAEHPSGRWMEMMTG